MSHEFSFSLSETTTYSWIGSVPRTLKDGYFDTGMGDKRGRMMELIRIIET